MTGKMEFNPKGRGKSKYTILLPVFGPSLTAPQS